MPIYEFYCADCHTVFNFFSRRINTQTVPHCPRCTQPKLERRLSIFAVSKGRKQDDNEPMGNLDEDRMEQAMQALAGEMEGVDGEDPRQAVQMMRKLYETTGLQMGAGMEEVMHRMEAGEDPEKIEQDMGPLLDEENPFVLKSKQGLSELRRKYLPPNVDATLYDLD